MSESTNDLHIDILPLKKAALILRAANHDLRQKMLHFLHHKGKVAVTELYVQLRLEQSVASQHLSVLRKAGFVHAERDGRFIYYSVNYERLKDIQHLTKELLN